MSGILSGLNEKQKEAVLETSGPVLILAGAGSGKTKALTHRIAYLIREKQVAPHSILAVTFTNKASREMSERVIALLGENPLEKRAYARTFLTNFPTMGTFHSICARILREDGHNLGFKRSFTIYDELDSLQAIKEVMKNLSITDKKASPQGVKSYISGAKNELIGPKKYEEMATGYFQELAAKIYPHYQKYLFKNNALDFDDLIFETVKLFQKHQDILKKYQDLWEYIHVDEYQDTNHAQYTLVNLLAAKNKNICVVGDDWQSIYSWRGADFQNILDFEHDYPNAKIVKLEQNYRSTKSILDAAHKVIARNEKRSEKTLWTDNEVGLPIVVAQVANEQEEARFVISESERLTVEENIEKNEIAVLYRTNAQSRALETELIRAGMAYRIVGGVRFYERREIKDVLAYLRIINSDDDWIAFQRIVNVPTRGIGAISLKKLTDFSSKHDLSISATLDQVEKIGLAPKAVSSLTELTRVLTILRKGKETESLPTLTKMLIERIGYEEYLNDGTVGGEERVENVKELLSVAQEYIDVHGVSDLEGFLEEISLVADIDNWNPEEKALTLMTIHAAKGLEFKIVFMIGMEENLFPHASSFFDVAQLEEERRLCYVAITRAMKRIYMTLTDHRLLYGGIHQNPPSRFLADIPEHLVMSYEKVNSGKEKEAPKEKISGYFQEGDIVVHEDFGEGKIIDADGDEIKVDFGEELGRKWLSITFANVKKKQN